MCSFQVQIGDVMVFSVISYEALSQMVCDSVIHVSFYFFLGFSLSVSSYSNDWIISGCCLIWLRSRGSCQGHRAAAHSRWVCITRSLAYIFLLFFFRRCCRCFSWDGSLLPASGRRRAGKHAGWGAVRRSGFFFFLLLSLAMPDIWVCRGSL